MRKDDCVLIINYLGRIEVIFLQNMNYMGNRRFPNIVKGCPARQLGSRYLVFGILLTCRVRLFLAKALIMADNLTVNFKSFHGMILLL